MTRKRVTLLVSLSATVTVDAEVDGEPDAFVLVDQNIDLVKGQLRDAVVDGTTEDLNGCVMDVAEA